MTSEYPSAEQIPQLRNLWKEAFGDTDAFLDAFFHTAFSPRRCRCITEEGMAKSVLYWFEVTCDDQRYAYLYAVATAAECRGRGLFSMLLEDTKRVLQSEGYAGILLVPQSEPLARMYEKFGFTVCTLNQEYTVRAGEAATPLREIGAQEYVKLRRRMLPAGSVLQEGVTLDFLATQYHFWAGEGWIAIGQIYDEMTEQFRVSCGRWMCLRDSSGCRVKRNPSVGFCLWGLTVGALPILDWHWIKRNPPLYGGGFLVSKIIRLQHRPEDG